MPAPAKHLSFSKKFGFASQNHPIDLRSFAMRLPFVLAAIASLLRPQELAGDVWEQRSCVAPMIRQVRTP
jgi:hypothetical protein